MNEPRLLIRQNAVNGLTLHDSVAATLPLLDAVVSQVDCRAHSMIVMPAKAGIQGKRRNLGAWIPAFAGMTK
jgi:hypothetical protein